MCQSRCQSTSRKSRAELPVSIRFLLVAIVLILQTVSVITTSLIPADDEECLSLSTELRNANATSHIHSLCAWNYTCERNSSRIPEKILVVDGNCRNIQPAGGTYDCETLYAVFPVKTGDNNCDRVTWDKWPVGCMAVERRTLPA